MIKPIYSTSQTTNIQSNRHNLHFNTKIIQQFQRIHDEDGNFELPKRYSIIYILGG